jgi:UDP-N-acetylglucosamine:LPS N-acetylglucosamine transferase
MTAPAAPLVVLVASSGGHLQLLQQLEPWWRGCRRLWVTFDTTDGRSLLRSERATWAHHPTTRNPKNAAKNLVLAWRLLRSTRPDLVVSTGAGVAFPFFIVAKLLRIRTVFIEAFERVESPSLTGRLCYPISDLFILQCDEQRRFYPKGHVVGSLY